MALGRYSRIDGNNSSNNCWTISIVVFVTTCLIGAWMTVSSSIGPGRMGISVQQFMGVMPQKRSWSDGSMLEDAVKGSSSLDSMHYDSKPNMQGNENVVQESKHPDSDESKTVESKEEKGVESEKDPSSKKKEEESISESGQNNVASPQIHDGVDTTTSDQVATREKSEDVIQQKSDGDGKSGQKETPEELIQPGETETKVEESGEYQNKKPTEKEEIAAMKMLDGVDNESENSGQEQSKVSEEDSSGRTSESVSNDGPEMSNQTSAQSVSSPTQSSELENEKDLEIAPSPENQIVYTEDSSGGTLESLSNDSQEISNQTSTQPVPSPTQSAESEKEKDLERSPSSGHQIVYKWKVCNVTAGSDYIPCLDNIQAIRKLPSTKHYEHRERHCPDEAPTCLVRLPEGYRAPIKWPKSREMIWFANVPHTKLAEYKRQQNWVKVYGRYITFPGGGTQFKHGALHYIDFIQQTVPDIAWGKRTRVILDVGCGVASFGGYLFERDVLTMSLAPKDEHEAQVQFALERGIPAISAVMGTNRLPFSAMVFDIVHCARCRVPWHAEGGKLLLELNRLLRPGGYFVWSATPVYRRGAEDSGIWKEMSKLTKSLCWELVQIGRDKVNGVSAAIYRKPTSNDCYEGRQQNDPPLCEESDDRNAAWYTPMQSCIHKVPTNPSERGTQWPVRWPSRVETPPYWLTGPEVEPNDKLESTKFVDDSNYWKHVVANSYTNEVGIDWSSVRNIMDMRASYGGFAAALKDSQVWVMNVVPVNSSDTLPVIYERGLFGIYHDWCESFSTYPRSYDLLHADHLFSDLKKRCKFVSVMAEVDRILRPYGWLIVRDDVETISEVERMAKSLQWKIQFNQSKDKEGVLCVQKTRWRPSEVETIMSAIG